MSDKRGRVPTWIVAGLGSVTAVILALSLFTPSFVVSLLSTNEIAFELSTNRTHDTIRLPRTSGEIRIHFEPANVEIFSGAEPSDTKPGTYRILSCTQGCSIQFAAISPQTATRVQILYLADDSEYLGDIPEGYQGFGEHWNRIRR